MAIRRTYWQGWGSPREPWTRCSPNLRVLQRHLVERAGGQPLGCHAVRSIRGGTSWSSHAFGAAFDWRYANVGVGYAEVGSDVFRSTVLPWLIEHADALGIQQIHDYRAARIWRSGQGWRVSSANHMGASWATYIHVETNVDSWGDVTPIAGRHVPDLDLDRNPNNTGGIDPMATRPVTFDHVTLTTRTPGPDKYVAAWQAMINELSGAALVVDGYYGKLTAGAVENLQRWYAVTIDGKLGPQTAGALLDRDPNR